MQCSSTAIYISGLMISSSAQPMRFSLSSTTRSLKMNWIIYFQICYLKYGVPCAVLYMIIGDIPSPPMVWELVSRSGGATFQLSPISPDHLALPQTLWPGRTGSALAWLKMLINGEIEEEEPNFRPLLFQQLFIWSIHFISKSMHAVFFNLCTLWFPVSLLWNLRAYLSKESWKSEYKSIL